MIGGVDIEIPTNAGTIALVAASRAIMRVWRHAVFENALSGDDCPRFDDVPFGTLSELFVYRDEGAKLLWDEEGAVPEANDAMIHLLAGEGVLVAVVDDDESAEIRIILGAIRSLLSDEIFVRTAA
jgi:hypothetical protein